MIYFSPVTVAYKFINSLLHLCIQQISVKFLTGARPLIGAGNSKENKAAIILLLWSLENQEPALREEVGGHMLLHVRC